MTNVRFSLCLFACALGPACSTLDPKLFTGATAASGTSGAGAGAPGEADSGASGEPSSEEAGSDSTASGTAGHGRAGSGGAGAPAGGSADSAGRSGTAGSPAAGGSAAGGTLGFAGGGGASGAGAKAGAGNPGSSNVCSSCDAVHSVLKTCSEVSGCKYSACREGYVDCDTSPPDSKGCSCRGDACCSTGCQTVHDNGLGANFYDCSPTQTYNLEQAFKAAAADTHDGGTPQANSCSVGSDQLSGVCKTGKTGSCTCWSYAGTGRFASLIGTVSVQPNGCACVVASVASWN